MIKKLFDEEVENIRREETTAAYASAHEKKAAKADAARAVAEQLRAKKKKASQ